MVAAVVARNAFGEVIHAATKVLKGSDPQMGEAEVARLGVQEAEANGYKQLVLEGDPS